MRRYQTLPVSNIPLSDDEADQLSRLLDQAGAVPLPRGTKLNVSPDNEEREADKPDVMLARIPERTYSYRQANEMLQNA